jgi:hypothetical protein
LRIGKVVVPALELLVEAILIALGALLESETNSRRKTIRGVIILNTALGEAGAIAASTVVRTSGEVSFETTASALMLLARGPEDPEPLPLGPEFPVGSRPAMVAWRSP